MLESLLFPPSAQCSADRAEHVHHPAYQALRLFLFHLGLSPLHARRCNGHHNGTALPPELDLDLVTHPTPPIPPLLRPPQWDNGISNPNYPQVGGGSGQPGPPLLLVLLATQRGVHGWMELCAWPVRPHVATSRPLPVLRLTFPCPRPLQPVPPPLRTIGGPCWWP